MDSWKMQFGAFIRSDTASSQAMNPLREGDTREDKAGAQMVLIVNESMAKHAWPGQDAVGAADVISGNPNGGLLPWATVVGVVGG